MSSECPPQLQLSIQPTTTSFKRSFEEFGFDLESPVGTRAVNAGESGATHSTGNERNKRARSRTSLDSEADGSMGSSAASQASEGGNVGASESTTTVEPPRLPTPVLPDVDMPSYPQEDEEESFSPRAAVSLPPTHGEGSPTNAFQLTLDRFNAFDREMEVLRQPEPNLSIATSSSSSSSISALVAPASPPVLPPLIIDPHRLSTEAIDFLPERSPLDTPEVFPLSVSVSSVNISSTSTLPDRSRESTSSPIRFRQNLDVALERLRSPSPLAPGFTFQDSPTTGSNSPHETPSHTIELGPPTLPPIPPIDNDLHDNSSEASEQNEEPSRPHAVLPNPPTLPPIPSVSDGFPDGSIAWDEDTTTPHLNPARIDARREEDLSFRPLSPEIPPGSINFERDFGQWFHPAEDSLSTSSVSTSAATAGTERETFGHSSMSASTALPTSPPSAPSALALHILRATQLVEESRQRFSSIAATDTEARRMRRLSAASSSSSRTGPSNTAPARSFIQDEFGTMANPFTTRPSLLDNVRPSSRFSYWEDRRRNSLEMPTLEEGWVQFRDRLASEIEDTEHRLRRRPRFLRDTVENPEAHGIFLSRPRSEPDTNTDFDINFSSLLGGERHTGTQAMEPSSSGDRGTSDSLHTTTDSWLERMRRHRENRMVVSDDEADDDHTDFLNQLFGRVGNEDRDASTRRSPPSMSRQNPRLTRSAWPPTADTNSGESTTLPSPDDDMDRALWWPGGVNRYAANRRSRDRFQSASGRAAAALPRPGASNSLVAESASEARRQADFESIRRRIRRTNPWDDLSEGEETRNARDVDEELNPSARSPPSHRRPSPPPLRRNRDNPTTHLAHLDFEDFSLYTPSQASDSISGPSEPMTSLSSLHRRISNDHLASNSRTSVNTANSRNAASSQTAARFPPAHSMVPPWELPDVSLPFGDLFETLGEGRNHTSHPQRSYSSNTGRSGSAPSLPHPDLGGTFTGQGYSSPDRLPAIPSDVDITAATQPAHVTSSRPESDNSSTPTAGTHRPSLLERHLRYVQEGPHDLLRLEEGYVRYGSPEMRHLRRGLPGAARHGSIHHSNATAISAATSPNSGGPSRPSASSSTSPSSTRQAPGTSQTSGYEPPRPGSYSTFLPGPFRNTLLHAERHIARTESSSRSNLTTPPVIPEMPFARDQSSTDESPFTSRPLPAESFYIRPRETSTSMFSSSWSRRDARETERREAASRADADFRQLMEQRDREMEVLRRRQQEAYEARTRQLRERARYRDPALIRSALQESMEMSRTMTAGERNADSNNSASGEAGNRPQSRRRLETLRLNPSHAGAGMRRTRFLGDYMRDEELDALSYESLLSLTELAGDVKPRATPAEVLEKMEKSTYKEWKTTDSDTRCPICLDDYEPDDPVQKFTNCSHWLHQDCLSQWLKSANTCPVCRGSVAETRPLGGGGRSVRTHSAFSGVSGAGRWRDMHSQTGPPPPGDNPGVSRFYHHVAAENINRMTRRRSRLAQLEQQVASASAASATAEGNSNAPPASSPMNNQGNGPLSSDSEDNQAELGFMHRFYGRR